MDRVIRSSGAVVRPPRLRAILLALTLFIVAGCAGSEPTGNSDGDAAPQADPSFPPAMSPYAPDIDPADFVEGIDNPYLTFEPGTTWMYEGNSEDEKETNTVSVTNGTKEILGVTCTVVKDVVYAEGEIAEKTFDWYAQDKYGNVWYFGEDSSDYENGKFKDSGGSWEAGVDGALPGIVMLGDPQVGDKYRQEYYKGEAEDMGQVLKLGASVEVPFSSYEDVLITKDWNPLEPGVTEHKYYARGVGVVLEQHVKGPKEVNKLVDVKQG